MCPQVGLASLLAESLDALLISLELQRRKLKLCNLRKMAVMIFPVRVEVCQFYRCERTEVSKASTVALAVHSRTEAFR